MNEIELVILTTGMIALFLWNRFELHRETKRTDQIIETIHELMHAIVEQNKDLHKRLAIIEIEMEENKYIKYDEFK